MGRIVHIYVQEDHADAILDVLRSDETDSLNGLVSFPGHDGCVLIHFTCSDKYCTGHLRTLEEMGVGESFGRVEVMPLSTSKPIKTDAYR